MSPFSLVVCLYPLPLTLEMLGADGPSPPRASASKTPLRPAQAKVRRLWLPVLPLTRSSILLWTLEGRLGCARRARRSAPSPLAASTDPVPGHALALPGNPFWAPFLVSFPSFSGHTSLSVFACSSFAALARGTYPAGCPSRRLYSLGRCNRHSNRELLLDRRDLNGQQRQGAQLRRKVRRRASSLRQKSRARSKAA